jgi:hypothetical protein
VGREDTDSERSPEDKGKSAARVFAGLLLAGAMGGGLVVAWKWRVEPMPEGRILPHPALLQAGSVASVPYASGAFVATVARFRDELFAYLMLQHYRVTEPLRHEQLFVTSHTADTTGAAEYRILVLLSRDYAESVRRAAELAASNAIEELDWRLVSQGALRELEDQTRLFDSAYNLPVRRRMEDLSKAELRRLVGRFVRFKSTTDPRVRRGLEPAPKVLSPGESGQLAADIIRVADFFGIPLEMFLGIGAMENNYMDVRGDLSNTAWKRKAEKDDIVLQRKGGRVRVLNDSAGVWQITRETLRYVHKLYLKDSRDYCDLPEHLRPPLELNVNDVDPKVLTTYAGLLLRDLLDRFEGDVTLAVGAYNGGPGRPNLRYEAGVRSVAAHAREVLERAAALNGESVMQKAWIGSAR